MTFEWDEAKNQANIEKHGISFEDACLIFAGPRIEVSSDRGGETRWKTTGRLGRRFVTMIYTLRGPNIRIISARRARINERRAYEDLYA